MKKAFLLFMTLSTLALSAQNIDSNKQGKWNKSKTEFTPEQRAELRSKQLTLDLDLNISQQNQVKELFLKSIQNNPQIGKKRSEMTSNEKFELKNTMLDQRIKIKKGLKEILNEDQFQKWEKTNYRKSPHSRKMGVQKKGGRH